MTRWRGLCALLLAVATTAVADDASWVTPAVDMPHVARRTFQSAAAGREMSYHIYVPEDYARYPGRRWPVLYWLHGTGGGVAGIAPLSEMFDRAIRDGLAPPMLVVFPNGLATSMWCDSVDGRVPMETVVVRELVAEVDKVYRTRAERSGRAIEGFSMGGYGAARLGFGHPEVFGAVSVLAGGPLDSGFDGPRARERPEERDRILREVYGGDLVIFRMQSPRTIASRNANAIRGRTLVRIVVGEDDPTAASNRAFSEHVERLGIEHRFESWPSVAHEPLSLLRAMGDARWAFYRRAFVGE
jgi:enterochelin esterase-like enzyme